MTDNLPERLRHDARLILSTGIWSGVARRLGEAADTIEGLTRAQTETVTRAEHLAWVDRCEAWRKSCEAQRQRAEELGEALRFERERHEITRQKVPAVTVDSLLQDTTLADRLVGPDARPGPTIWGIPTIIDPAHKGPPMFVPSQPGPEPPPPPSPPPAGDYPRYPRVCRGPGGATHEPWLTLPDERCGICQTPWRAMSSAVPDRAQAPPVTIDSLLADSDHSLLRKAMEGDPRIAFDPPGQTDADEYQCGCGAKAGQEHQVDCMNRPDCCCGREGCRTTPRLQALEVAVFHDGMTPVGRDAADCEMPGLADCDCVGRCRYEKAKLAGAAETASRCADELRAEARVLRGAARMSRPAPDVGTSEP